MRCTKGPQLSDATYTPQHSLPWRRPAETRSLPQFFLNTLGIKNETATRASFRAMMGDRPFESVLPNTWTQYLSDLPILDALASHPSRVQSSDAAQWQVLDAALYTSYLVGAITEAPEAHAARMAELAMALTANPRWRQPGVRWLVIQPHYDLPMVAGHALARLLATRNQAVGPVVLATVDRSGTNIQKQRWLFDLYRRALMLPHVSTPELARWAAACARGSAGGGCARPISGSSSQPHESSRRGWMFHGDMERFDGGVRGAMRSIIRMLDAPTSLQARAVSRGMLGDGAPHRAVRAAAAAPRLTASEGHVGFRRISAATTATMLGASLCLCPAGDMVTTRRLFDALASGCVPVLLKGIGTAPRQWLLGNNPFHHSIEWRAVGVFMAPRGVSFRERLEQSSSFASPLACRAEEARWLDAIHNDTRLLHALRRKAAAAFHAHLDVEFNAAGVARALVRELAHVLDDDCEARHYILAYNQKHHPHRSMSINGYLHLPARTDLLNEAGIAAAGDGCQPGEEMLMEMPVRAPPSVKGGRKRVPRAAQVAG